MARGDGTPGNRELIRQMAAQQRIRIQLGGGLRTRALIDDAFTTGVSRAVIGSAAVEDPQLLRDCLAAYGADRICLAIDVRVDAGGIPRVRTRGWVKEHELSLWELLQSFADTPLRHVLCTDIERDGALGGPGFELYTEAQPAFSWHCMAGVRWHPFRSGSCPPGHHGSCSRHQRQGLARRPHQHGGVATILARRLIPCLDVRDGQVVKGVRFRDHRVVGEILELSERYRDEGADELVFYDITASPEGRSVDRSWISRVAAVLDIPFCVAGGIRSVADAEAILNAGAEKVSVNSPRAGRSFTDRPAGGAFRLAVRGGGHRQPDHAGRFPRLPVHRRSGSLA